ncbi:MAG: matrixin family metalloprotease, partial [Hyphomicrobium sp.]
YWGGTNWKWGTGAVSFNVQNLTFNEQALARQALHAWSTVANLTFSEVFTGGQMVFNSADTGTDANSAYANFGGSAGFITSATVNIGNGWMNSYYNAATQFYNYAFQTYVHEIGHALGLGHQGNYNGSAVYDSSNNFANDSWQFSVMSYFGQDRYNYNGAGSSYLYVSGPMQADILAMLDKYGAATAANHYFGDAASALPEYSVAGGVRAFTMFSPDGWVGLDSSTYGGAQTINMNALQFSSTRGNLNNIGNYSNMSYYNGGSGVDDITLATTVATGADNRVFGNGGADIFRSSGGSDHCLVDGGAGSDTYARAATQLTNVAFHHTSQSQNGWVIGTGSGSDTLFNIETASFFDGTKTLRADARADLTADGSSDVIWYNAAAGAVNYWDMDNGSVSSWNLAGVVSNTWAATFSGDVNGDGGADILFRRGSDGAIGFLK